MRIVFMGTPDYALPSLCALLGSEHEVAGVFTQPDKPSGRGNHMNQSPVKKKALKAGIPVYQPRRPEAGHRRHSRVRADPFA